MLDNQNKLNNIDTTKIEEFFYDKSSERISDRVKKSKLKYKDIYSPDEKQISRIINNKRTKNNRFLICNAVIDTYHKEESTGEYIKIGLLNTPQLRFNSRKEILWGTDEEISKYIKELFRLLWNELENNSPDYKKEFNEYLCDYIPYSKCSTYYDLLFSRKNNFPAVFFGIREDDILENFEPSKRKSLDLLYDKCKEQWLNEFLLFANNEPTFSKLNKTIREKLLPLFINVIESHKPDSKSLGLRVRSLILSDLSLIPELITKNKPSNSSKLLINATSQYIVNLEKTQKQKLLEEKKM